MPPKAFVRPLKIAALCLLASLPLLAQSTLADRWLAGLRQVDQLLRGKQWKEAADRGRRVAWDILQSAGTGDGASYSLAVISAFRAIAEAELGNEADAAWHWDSALNLDPKIAKTNVAPYGAKAAELQRRPLRESEKEMNPEMLRLAGEGAERAVDPAARKVEKPRIREMKQPEYPEALSRMGVDGVVVLSSVIGEDGRPSNPLILETKGVGPAAKYAALDAVRQWRFHPATLEGKPVAVYYVLTVNFKAKG
jgi:TonB family protein